MCFRYMENKWFEPLNEWLKKLAFFDILDRLGKAVILITVVSYGLGHWARQENAILRAWQVISQASGEPGDLGRKRALEFLIKNDENLAKVKLKKAVLVGAHLSNGHLREADFAGADLSGAHFDGANLQNTDFTDADLRGSILVGADLRDALFARSEFGGVNLAGARVGFLTWVKYVAETDPVPYGFDAYQWCVVEEMQEDSTAYVVRPNHRPQEICPPGGWPPKTISPSST